MTVSLSTKAPDSLLRHEEAAKYLGVSSTHLRRARHTGELFKGFQAPKYIKLGHAVRYRKSTLDEWLEALPEFRSTADYQSVK
jgi:excisionase family DNA binding protein